MSRGQSSVGRRGRPTMRQFFAPTRRSKARPATPQRRSMRVETLEDRHLLALSDVSITSAQQTTLLDGLDGFVDWAEALDAHGQLNTLLPVVGQPIGAAMDLGGTLQTALVDRVGAYFAGDASPTTGELVTALKALDGNVYPGLIIDVDSMTVSGGRDDISGDEELVFGLTLVAMRSIATHPSLGLKGEALGLAFDATYGAVLEMTLDFSFGMDLSAGLAPEDAFFVRINDWDTTVAATPTFASSSSMRAGFLDATLVGGSMSLSAAIDVDVANPDADPQGDITLAELDPDNLAAMISTGTSGSASGSVSFTGHSFAGFTPTGTATASFTTSTPFTPPDITFSAAFDQLRPFTNITATSFLGVLSQLGISLDNLGDSTPFDLSLHVAKNKTLGDTIKLGRLFSDPTSGLIELLSPGPDVTPNFKSAQTLTTSLATALGLSTAQIAPTYNSTTHELTYYVELSRTFAAEMLDVGFDIDLGSLLGISTSSKVAATVTGDLQFTIGVDLEELEARLVPSADGPTDGVLTSDADFSLSVAATSPVAVSVAAASTVTNTSLADLAADFNTALAAAGLGGGVAAVVDGGKLVLRTMGDLPIESLRLTAAAGNAILTQLHFKNGQLAVDTIAQHVFVEDFEAEADLALSATDIDATARFGFLSAGILNGTASGTFGADFALKDEATQTVGGRVFVPEILRAVAGDVTTIVDGPTLSGSLSATLPITASILGTPVSGNPEVTISWPDVLAGAPSVTFNNFSELNAYEDVGEGNILDALEGFASFLAGTQGVSLYDVEIPGIGVSMGEAFDFAQEFLAAVQQFTENPNGTLDQLESKIETALGLAPADLNLTWVSAEDVLRIDLTLSKSFTDQFRIDIDLLSQGLGRLVDISGSGLLNATAQATLDLDFGIDLSNPSDPRPFFYETTSLDVKGRVAGDDIEFTTALGPLGIFVAFGKATIDGDGEFESTADRAALSLHMTDGETGTTDAKLYLDELDFDNVELDLTGRVTIDLPVFFPTSTNFAGHLLLTVTDLGDIGGTTTVTGPDFDAAIAQLKWDDLSLIIEAFDAVLAGLEDVFNGQIFGQRLPFVGDQLKDAADFIHRIRADFIDQWRRAQQESAASDSDAMQRALFDAFGPNGLNLLRDKNNSGTITINDITLTKRDVNADGEDDQTEWDMILGTDIATIELPIDFDIGLPGLGLEVDGSVQVRIGFEWMLGLGNGRDEGYYLKTDKEDEITVFVRAEIPDFKAKGELFFLQLNASDEDADDNPLNDGLDADSDGKLPSRLSLDLVVDLKDPIDDPMKESDNDKLTLNDFFAAGFSFGSVLDARLDGVADINLDLMASIGGDARFPSIGAELAIHWPFTSAGEPEPGAPAGSPDMNGDAPTVKFENITLNVGETIGEFLAPVLKTIRQVTEPFDPVIEFLQMPVPVLSSFGQEVRILDILQTIADAYGYGDLAEFINAVIDVIGVINDIPDTPNTVIIPLGSFDLLGADPRDKNALVNFDPHVTQSVDAMQEAKDADAEAGGFLEGLNAIGIHLPLLEEPANIFKLMMGQTVDLIQYDMPKLDFGLPIGPFKIGPIAGYPIWAVLSGWVGAEIDLAFGFDTRGFELYSESGDVWDIFSGLYIWDLENLDGTGGDGPEVSLVGRVDASAEVGFNVIGAGAGGGLTIEIGADLVDPNEDGKVHLDEFLDNIERGVTCTFDLVGAVFVDLFVYFDVLYARFEYRSPRLKLVDFRLTDEDCYPDRFDSNDSRGDAVYVGVAPGIHMEGMSLETIGDEDWYEFTLLRADSITVGARHSDAKGDVDVRVYNAAGAQIGSGRDDTDGSTAELDNLAAGNYFVRVSGTGRLNNYKLQIEPAKSSDTRVIYVSPSGSHGKDSSYYTYDSGSDSNSGLSPRRPKASLQSVIDSYALGPNDLIVFERGNYSNAATLTAADSPALFVGSVGGSTVGALALVDADGHWFYNLDFTATGATNISLTNADDNRFESGQIEGAETNVVLVGSNGNRFENMDFAGPTNNVVLTASHDNVFIDDEFGGSGIGIHITDATIAPPASPLAEPVPPGAAGGSPGSDVASSGNLIFGSQFESHAIGVRIDSPRHNTVENNTFVTGGGTGIRLARGVTSTVTGNDVAERALGIYTDSKVADLYGNLIHNNAVGMESRHGIIGPNNEPPYGTPGGKAADQVFENTTGILVPSDGAGVLVRFTDIYENDIGMEIYGDRSRIIANDIHNNEVGVVGTRIIGPENWESLLDNRIHHNAVGVRTLLGAEVRFNRIDHNGIGVEITEGSYVHHNLIVRNSGDGVFIHGPDFAGLPEDGFVQTYLVGADVINNTIFAPAGNAMRLDGFMRDVVLRNNIAMVASGSALAVHAAAQGGFSSDYNNLYATGPGRVATFFGAAPIYFSEPPKSKGFADLFDWQVEGNTDLHSLGRTSLAPMLDDPLFVDFAGDDYHLTSGSTSIDAGDPSFSTDNEPAPNGGRINLGAYGGTTEAAASPLSWLRITAPEFYVDLIPTDTYTIAWDSHNLPAGTMLDITAKQEGALTTHVVATVAASAGSTTWSPSVVGISGSLTDRWRVEIRTTSGPLLVDASREPFSVVPFVGGLPNSFYVDDASNAGDQYTPSAVGNNRNPGLTPELPKAAARALLLSYPMGSGDTLYFDAGEHIHVLNLNMRRTPTSLDPMLRPVSGTFITGPTNGSVATIDRANPYPGAIAIDMRDAPDMTLVNVEVRGGDFGVAVHDGSGGFTTDLVKYFRNTHDGLTVYNNSPGAWIDRIEAWENGRHGIFVESTLDHVRDTIVYDNGATGMALRGVGAAVVERSEAYCTGLSVLCQRTGIDIINPGPLQAVVGNLDLSLFLGNKAHHNGFEGIFASGNVLVAGNSGWNNGYYGIRLDDGADAHRNVVHHHVTGISALGSTSDIVENRSYINTDKGIEAGLESNILRNVTYSNGVNGIYGQRFSGLMEHNLVYATGDVSVHIEGPGKGAQFINNTVYETCSVNDSLPGAVTTMDVSWDWQTQFMPLFSFPFSALLWGESRFEFGVPNGENGETFDLGPGGLSNALTAMPVPPGQTWHIPYSVSTLELHTMTPTPLGQLSARLLAPAIGAITVENIGGQLVGNTTLSMQLEFTFSGNDGGTVLWSEPIIVGKEFGPTDDYNEFEALQTVIPISQIAPPLPPTLRRPGAPPSDPPWGTWLLQQGRESQMPIEQPQDRGESCAKIAVLVDNFSHSAYFRNNIIYAEGDATPGIPPDGLSVDVVVAADSTTGWDSNFNALMTIHGLIGVFGGASAATLPVWQSITSDDMHSISPMPSVVWVDPDGMDNALAGGAGFDDNFHLRSPFGQAMTGALAPILDNIPGGTDLPIFEPVTFVGGPGPGDDGVSPAIDWGDPDFAFFAETPENGKFINLGAYGNTTQSSSTETEYVNMVFPLGVEQLASGATYEIRWRSHDHLPGATVSIELRHDDENGLVEWSDALAPNTGSYKWTIPPFVPLDTNYVIVVRRPSVLDPANDVIGISRRTFEIGFLSYGPTVLRTLPEAVHCETVTTQISSIFVTLSDNMDSVAVTDVTNYELVEAGASGAFDDGDDVSYSVFPTYTAGGLLVDTSTILLDLAGVSLAEGRYRLTIFSSLFSGTLLPLDGDDDGLAGGNYVREFTVDLTSPTYTIDPVVPAIRNTPIDDIQFQFDEPVTGFGVADVRLTRDGGPNLLWGVNSLITSTDDMRWMLGNLSRLTADEGFYELTLTATDSNIRDLAGNPLLIDSTISWEVETTAPRAIVTPVSPDPRSTGISSLTVTFSEPVYDFTTAGFEILHDETPIALGASQTPTTSDNVTWTIPNLAGLLAAEGIYLVRIQASGPTHDLAGNTLAGDADETWEVLVAPPLATISPVSPDPRNASVGALTISFDKPVVGVSLSDLSLTRGASGNLLTAGQTLSTVDNQTFTLAGLSPLTSGAGDYMLRLIASGSGILDLGDNPLVGDATSFWTTDLSAPTLVDIVDVSPDPRKTPVGSIAIVFSKPVFGFDLGALTLERTSGGGPASGSSGNLLTAAQTLTTSDGVTWTLGNLASLTAAEGSYTLSLVAAGSQIVDVASNALSAGGSENWSVDTTAPTVDIVDVTPDPRTTAVASITIAFSEAVTGFDRGDLVLTRNGSVVIISAAQSLSSSDGGATWTLANLGGLTAQPGRYELSLRSVGSGIADLVGNSLPVGTFDGWLTTLVGDFDQDGVVGQADLAILQGHMGASGATALDGDMNGDTLVNRTDARLFAQVYGRSALVDPPGPPPAEASPQAADAVMVRLSGARHVEPGAIVTLVARRAGHRADGDASRRAIGAVDAAMESMGRRDRSAWDGFGKLRARRNVRLG
ncbi:MAG: NosD domain-containing protein [Pirellulales bacterium]